MAVRLLGATALDELYLYLDGQYPASLSVVSEPQAILASSDASYHNSVFTSDMVALPVIDNRPAANATVASRLESLVTD